MIGAWSLSHRRWFLWFWCLGCTAFPLAFLTTGTSATPLLHTEHSDNIDDSGDNTLFRGNDAVIMGDRDKKLGSYTEAPSTVPDVGGDCDQGCEGDGDSDGGDGDRYPFKPEDESLRKIKPPGDSVLNTEAEVLGTIVDPSESGDSFTVLPVPGGPDDPVGNGGSPGGEEEEEEEEEASSHHHHPPLMTLPASQPPDTHLQATRPVGVVHSKQHGSDKQIDIIQTRSSHQTPPRGHQKVTHREGHPRVPRSLTEHDTSIQPANCRVSPSCSDPDHPAQEGGRYPCSCDDHCRLYGDCCRQNASRTPTPWQPSTVTPALLTCRSLTPLAHRDDPAHRRMVHMVNRCPVGTASQLAAMCAGSVPPSKPEIVYMMDIPVVSNKSGIVYSNIFCAKCHHDAPIERLNISITCLGNQASPSQLADMTYHSGELRWTKGSVAGTEPREANVSCLLRVHYPEAVGRWCESEVVDTCSRNWSVKEDQQHRCSSYNYYVEAGYTVYKNWDCAVCNDVPEEDIKCLSKNLFASNRYTPPSLMDLFIVDGDCKDYQVWDFLNRRCENVSCGSLFSLQDGECVRNNKTITPDGRSRLNISCYTRDFNREYSVLFPNQSVYLNHTEQIYNFGEYEFNHSWIRVCRPEDRWTPVMSILSAVLISISLLCMLLHIIIFLALPKRRNIPSMNLLSMTCSLFIAEFMYLAFFHMNQNYSVCVVIGVIIYYFLCASFMWMNVMSIDICRTFLSSTYMMKSRAIFIQYSIYAWSVPTASSLVAIIVDQASSSESILTPQFGTDVCWFNNKWGLVAFFTFPSGFVILVNMMLYGVSVFNIYRQLKSGEFASSTVQRKHSSTKKQKNESDKERKLKPSVITGKETLSGGRTSEKSESPRCKERLRERIQRGIDARKKQRVRLVLYCKLALMMGMTWVFAFISIHTKDLVFEYLFIFFNGLQGAFILIAFDCKQKVWDELKQKLAGRTVFRSVSSRSSSNTKSSEVKSSEGSYRYRWSSKMRQDGSRKYSAVSQDLGETRSSQERDESGV